MKFLQRLGIVLGILLVLLLAIDRLAVVALERSVVSAVEQKADGVEVQVHGFPFLTQAAAGELDHVTGAVDQARFGQSEVSEVTFDAHGVAMSSPYRVRQGIVTGTLPMASVQEMVREETNLDLEVTAVGKSLELSGTVLGLELAALVVPRITGDTSLGVEIQSARVGGAEMSLDQLPFGLGEKIAQISVTLDIPEGIRLESVDVTGDGLRARLAAENIALAEMVGS